MANTNIVAPSQAIMHTPGVCGGDACIRMTRIPVWLLVQYRRLGLNDVALLEAYPTLTRADLAAARDYQLNHMAEIDQAIAEQEQDD